MTNLVAGIVVFIVIIVGSLGFIMISNGFDNDFTKITSDPINNTGIQSGSVYDSVKIIDHGISDNTPIAILIGLLLVAILIILAIWGIVGRS